MVASRAWALQRARAYNYNDYGVNRDLCANSCSMLAGTRLLVLSATVGHLGQRARKLSERSLQATAANGKSRSMRALSSPGVRSALGSAAGGSVGDGGRRLRPLLRSAAVARVTLCRPTPAIAGSASVWVQARRAVRAPQVRAPLGRPRRQGRHKQARPPGCPNGADSIGVRHLAASAIHP